MAVFRKILSATKNKIRAPDLKIQAEKGGASTSYEPSQADEEFERRKQEWQDELEEMSEFLLIKSAAEQIEEGAQVPVDTAFIEEKDGLPVLKALFDVHHFRPEDISIDVNESELYLQAKTTEDKDDRVYTKTMLRKIALPEQVDPRNLHC
jgi:HSP20 family molecular chaperone IbpA